MATSQVVGNQDNMAHIKHYTLLSGLYSGVSTGAQGPKHLYLCL